MSGGIGGVGSHLGGVGLGRAGSERIIEVFVKIQKKIEGGGVEGQVGVGLVGVRVDVN